MCGQPAIENRATSHIQPLRRRHIEDEHAPETVQVEGLVGGETERRGPETGGADNEKLQRRQKGKDKASIIHHAQLIISTAEIEYWCSKAPINQIWLLGERLFEAAQSSNQWKWERDLGGLTTDCLNALVPKDRSQDISITLVVGHKKGVELIKKFNLSSL
jgi:hypothetical protein